MLIIYVWAVLSVVLIGYVVYRIFTDRKSDGKRHPLYPLVSNPTDGMFPAKGKSWIGYLLAFVALLVLLIKLLHEVSK